MTPQETALAFAQEILEWEDAFIGGEPHFIGVPASDDGFQPESRFLYNELNAVRRATRRFCAKTKTSIPITIEPWGYSVNTVDGRVVMEKEADLCLYLMELCLSMSNRLKGAA